MYPFKKPLFPLLSSLLTLWFVPFSLVAQVEFSGELVPSLNTNIAGKKGFDDSPLNPDNQLKLNDVMYQNEIDLKLSTNSPTAWVDLWIQVNSFPIANIFVGSAVLAEGLAAQNITGAPSGTVNQLQGYGASAAGLFATSNSYIYTLGLLRANLGWRPTDNFTLSFGRQSFLTGYGYGWNPSDLANPPKNPTDPQAYLRGIDALNLQYSPANWLNMKAYTVFSSPDTSISFEDMLVGGELSFYIPFDSDVVPSLEFQLSGLWGGIETGSQTTDPYPNAGGAAFYLDLAGLGFYGEGSIRSRSRRNLPNATGGASTLNEEITYSALGGLEYNFPDDYSLIVEYFYNGEGWNDAERKTYGESIAAQTALGGISAENYALFTPSYFSQHYLLLNFAKSWYNPHEVTVNLNTIYSIDSKALILTPTITTPLNNEGNLVAEIWYSGLFSFDDSEFNEAYLSPVRNSLLFKIRYYF